MSAVRGFRSRISVSLIVALVLAIYVFSPLPFLLGEQESKIAFGYYLYVTPVMVIGLIALLILKSNKTTQKEKTVEEKVRSARRTIIKIGVVGGFASACFISLLIMLSEVVIGFPSGFYFAVLGTVIGVTTSGTAINGVYLGFVAHLLTGTAIGAIFGTIMSYIPVCDVKKGAQTIVLGLFTGFMAFIVLFNPISRLGIEPGLVETLSIVMSDYSYIIIKNTVNEVMSTLLAGSIIMHLIYGAILGTAVHLFGRRA